jgi:hypothetical protein
MDYEALILGKMKEENRCPICGVIEDLEYDLLAHLQFEITERTEVRDQVVAAGGFCPFHFRQFRKLASEKTNALFLEALVARSLGDKVLPQAGCFVCERTSSHETQLSEKFICLLEKDAFRAAYDHSNGLCLPHLESTAARTPSPEAKEFLYESQRRQLKSLGRSLKKLISRAWLDTSDNERSAIARAVEKLVGHRGVGF